MDNTLLKTKLYIPPKQSKLVSRPLLLERLKLGLRLKLTLVAAPAGYGKTTLLSKGIHDNQMPVGWLTLDKDDNDPIRFWSYFVSALQTVYGDIGKAVLRLLQSPQPPTMEYVTSRIINEMSEVSEDFAIILDDYHMIEAQPIHDSMAFLLNHLPPQTHLVIASRTDPPIPLTRFRVQNQLVEIRADDLRFIPEEATAFLNDVMNLGLSDEDVATLESRTEGWIASLQLAAISMQGRENVSAFITEFSGNNRYIMDYLIEEVLDRQIEANRSFLLKTSVLNRFTASLCDAVIGSTDSRERLAQFDATNLFLVPLDDERKWYRYHHLFAELLRNQLMLSQQKDMTELHIRASKWFEQEGLIDEAIYHALEANDFERTANLIESVAQTMIMLSYCSKVVSWLEQLPGSLITERPWLCLYGARCSQLIGRQDSVDSFLQSTELAMSRAEEDHPTESFPDHIIIRNRMRIIRITYFLFKGENQTALELGHEALKHLPEDDLEGRASVVVNLGIAYWVLGDMSSARRCLEEANTLSQTSGNLYYSLFSMSYLGEIHRVQGHLHQAAQQYREAFQLGSKWGDDEPLPATGDACVNLSRILYEWNDINGAIQQASLGIQVATRGGVNRTILIGYSLLAWQNQACGNLKAVSDALQQTEGIIPKANPKTIIHASAWKARISLSQGDLNAANRWASSQEPSLNIENIPDFWSELPYLVLVRIRLAQGKIDNIPGLLDKLAQKVEAEQRTGCLIEILALQSIAFQAQGNPDKALDTLERALSLAEPEGYIRTFTDEGEPMAKLLRLAESRGTAKKYVSKLLASFHLESESQSRVSPAEGAAAMSNLVEPLSERELEVLGLIVDGKSNREIAETLYIVEGTVKTHINNIYGKLDVQSRTQAIARARELKLL